MIKNRIRFIFIILQRRAKPRKWRHCWFVAQGNGWVWTLVLQGFQRSKIRWKSAFLLKLLMKISRVNQNFIYKTWTCNIMKNQISISVLSQITPSFQKPICIYWVSSDNHFFAHKCKTKSYTKVSAFRISERRASAAKQVEILHLYYCPNSKKTSLTHCSTHGPKPHLERQIPSGQREASSLFARAWPVWSSSCQLLTSATRWGHETRRAFRVQCFQKTVFDARIPQLVGSFWFQVVPFWPVSLSTTSQKSG